MANDSVVKRRMVVGAASQGSDGIYASVHPALHGICGGVRPTAGGRFIGVGREKLYVRGVTYGTFRPDENGNQYHNLQLIERDFAAMAANGIISVRVYNLPPHPLLDLAARN